MRIALVHYPGRLARLEAVRAGDAPGEFLFGALELERSGHRVDHYEVDPRRPPRRPRPLLAQLARRGHLPPHLSPAVLEQTRDLLPQLALADVVVGTTTPTALGLAVWRRSGSLPTPLVGIVSGLVNAPGRRSRRWTTRLLLRQMEAVLYGVGELAGMLALEPRLRGRVHVDPFGVDTSFWTPAERRASGVVAIGNDGHRDWRTLVEAAPRIPAEVRIFTRRQAPPALPPNLRWSDADWYTQVLSDIEVRELYRSASVVVVPVEDVPQPSGQSVALQAMACERPVVLTRTRGLWAPDALRDGENVSLVPPADASALAAATRALLEDEARARAIGVAARETVVREATLERFARRLEEICRRAAATAPGDVPARGALG
jgi:glycosyltransferase involved in cell wall biosynthesis